MKFEMTQINGTEAQIDVVLENGKTMSGVIELCD